MPLLLWLGCVIEPRLAFSLAILSEPTPAPPLQPLSLPNGLEIDYFRLTLCASIQRNTGVLILCGRQ